MAIWPGWEIRYAYDGVAELADYVGGKPHVHEWPKCPTTKLEKDRSQMCQVVSVIDAAGQLRLWPLRWTVSQAWHGPALLDKLPGTGRARLKLRTFPEGGVHVDARRNRRRDGNLS